MEQIILLSVCLFMLLRSQFLFNFDYILHRVWGLKKNAFVISQNPMTTSPILPQFFTPVMHFQWEGPNTTITRSVDLLWGLRAQTTCLGSTKLQNAVTLILPHITQKWGSLHFQWEYAWLNV